MASHRISLFPNEGTSKKPISPVRLPPRVQDDVFLKAILETPTRKPPRRSPLEWAGAMALHVMIVAALIIVPLYTTAKITLNEYNDVPLVAPPPPPPPAVAAMPAAPHIAHPRAQFTYTTRRLTAPKSIPKTIAQESNDAAPELGGVIGGVPGGVAGGELGGIGGVFGGTGTAPRPPQPQQSKPTLVRAGSLLKAPRQTYNVNPEYPTLALQTRIRGVVVVDAIIDEKGNVVQARAVSGHPLLIPAALKAVLQWRYEPSSLNGRPVAVELEVRVNFNPQD